MDLIFPDATIFIQMGIFLFLVVFLSKVLFKPILAVLEARDEMQRIAQNMTYMDFSSSNLFFDEYQQAMFLPHTDMNAFPTVKGKM